VYGDTDDNTPWHHIFAATVHTAGERANGDCRRRRAHPRASGWGRQSTDV